MTDSDDSLLRRLGAMLDGADPPPDQVVEAALAAFDWRDPDAELARLVDSTAPATAAVRGGGSLLRTYRMGEVDIDIEVTVDGPHVTVLGQVAPVRRLDVRAEQLGGVRETTTDAWGRFAFDGLGTGPTRLAFHDETGPIGVTPWIVL
ncbi:hypothetical protein GCM10010168_34950 [Actinoplanes ianthinogenes]|uniref:Carboxypeptidase regulatory-like domain-containing protein n=1 Tax=Actinoplanes ianthinogenes TaxID=122358 RepID=A0ABN6CPC6_9ACTN|nr:hypothetical protein [Actinoplanes ianthinogenes]BCJ46985.1 hypothetical protein Aiant_76420 [Actinoplanes ianthinogenes]GGR14161.1 hypothetical protein GCM10010168_34950 [Actinoplanes ianthinogenes]